jgi:hypothetical protein
MENQYTSEKEGDEGLLSKNATAKRLGICTRTLDKRVAEGLIPCVWIGKLPRFIPSDIDQFIHAHRVGGSK